MILTKQFYNRPALQVAQDLLGCFLIKTSPRPLLGRRGSKATKVMKFKIVETEAYHGPNDLASHASRGKTERNQVMFDEPGLIYVYFTYGLHFMLNIVTGKRGYPAAVLIRAVEPVDLKFNNQKSKIKNLKFNGPARLTKALKINKTWNGRLIYTKKHGLWITGREQDIKPSDIIKTTRIGVDYAGKYKDKKWRFYIKDNKFVSKK
ncbi:DNA-3-methyladenine glycosylase [Candidatus Falkowbacteria bacterium CG_4_9_14_3_um_filter_38_19]|uniref:Putative 3-methyladenine DNA glycosylase n=1 Tax=Candidatus Falkowbacteria bacterium CG_4_9_14_3_um_filter_38_19 TaxID=1974559 RepID=A0A2M8AGF8_9BACT|nr:DNA-3-methyladenine glycosylase [Candidatus Parcubacteria bacterium]PJB16659.1 MAG: DNA-3-methyladenine glycosylase [Candidatus Falkowbacteria bacterium CG_4_9_14_3_um_filter_38_19]